LTHQLPYTSMSRPVPSFGVQGKEVDGAGGESGGDVAAVVGETDAGPVFLRQLPLARFRQSGELPENDSAAFADRDHGFSIRRKQQAEKPWSRSAKAAESF